MNEKDIFSKQVIKELFFALNEIYAIGQATTNRIIACDRMTEIAYKAIIKLDKDTTIFTERFKK